MESIWVVEHENARPHGLPIEGARRIHGHIHLALELAGHAFVFEAGHLHVAAQRDPGQSVFGLAPAPRQNRRAKADREAHDLNPDRLGGQEVPELVHEHQHAQNDEERDQAHTQATILAWRRASASA